MNQSVPEGLVWIVLIGAGLLLIVLLVGLLAVIISFCRDVYIWARKRFGVPRAASASRDVEDGRLQGPPC
jgi:hypothetical protein